MKAYIYKSIESESRWKRASRIALEGLIVVIINWKLKCYFWKRFAIAFNPTEFDFISLMLRCLLK